MQVVERERFVYRGVDDGDVGVAAGGDSALARIHAEYLGGVGRCDVHKPLQGHAALDHAFGVGDAHARLYAVVSAGYIGHRLEADLLFPSGGHKIGGDGGNPAVKQSVPQRLCVRGVFERRVGVILHSVGFAVVFGAEAGVVVQRFAVNRQALRARFAHGVHAFARAHMHEIDGTALVFGQPYSAAKGHILR